MDRPFNLSGPMIARLFPYLAAPLIACALLTSCASRDTRAANDAAQAEAAYQQGDFLAARRHVRDALALRDDVSDYWILLGRISLATGEPGVAYGAYQNVIQLDRSNVETLRVLCQLALGAHMPDDVDRYAAQLLLLNPDDPMPVTMKGGAALQRGDPKVALDYADQVLARNPNELNALMLKARTLSALKRYKEATALVESSFATTPTSPGGRLDLLAELYTRAGDRAGYERALARAARAAPKDAAAQFRLANLLYETGRGDDARAVVARLMRSLPDDVGLAGRLLELWMEQGADALPLATLAADARGFSLEMRAAQAFFADEVGRPDVAIALLGGGVADAPVSSANSDAKAALALAWGLQGRSGDALALLGTVLEADPAQPRALMARARLFGAAKKYDKAVADARRVVADDKDNVTARLLLADLLFAQGETVLGTSTLREGMLATPGDPRIGARLAGLLLAAGRKAEAEDVANDVARGAPVSLRSWRLSAQICARTGNAACVQNARAILAGRSQAPPVDVPDPTTPDAKAPEAKAAPAA